MLLLSLLVFAFAVTRGSGAYPVAGRAYEDYRLQGYETTRGPPHRRRRIRQNPSPARRPPSRSHNASEKLLVDLGGLFSKKWKPKKNGAIRGPMLTRDDSFIRKGSLLEQRQKLGLADHPPRSNACQFHSEPSSALEKVEMEKAKQDDAVSDLSNILTELKGMAVDMGSEIVRQTKAMGDAEKDYDELNFRVNGANTRARRLLRR